MKIISPSLLNSDTYQIKEQFEAFYQALAPVYHQLANVKRG